MLDGGYLRGCWGYFKGYWGYLKEYWGYLKEYWGYFKEYWGYLKGYWGYLSEAEIFEREAEISESCGWNEMMVDWHWLWILRISEWGWNEMIDCEEDIGGCGSRQDPPRSSRLPSLKFAIWCKNVTDAGSRTTFHIIIKIDWHWLEILRIFERGWNEMIDYLRHWLASAAAI